MSIIRTMLLLIGVSLSFGTAAAQDEVRPEVFADLCVNEKVVASCHQIALLYADKEIGIDDLNSDGALSLDMMIVAHEISCANNRGEACYVLRRLHGLDCNFDCNDEDFDKSVVAQTKGCDLDYLPSCVSLGFYQLYGTGSLTADVTKARTLFDKACERGPGFCADIANSLFRGDKEDLSLADMYVPYALRSCPADGSGTPDACFDTFFNMEVYNRPQDFEEMYRIMGTLCEQHKDAEGCFSKAIAFEDGLYGAAPDPIKAAEFYVKACDLGITEACQ